MAKIKEDRPVRERLNDRATKLEDRDFKPLIDQIEKEYQIAFSHMIGKWDTWEVRLKLYNNQKRDKSAVGDPLIFTIHQSVLASLYNDQLVATFEAREEGDRDRAEQLMPLAEFDYDEMDKDIIDYEWDWDASFFGVGYCLLMEFLKDYNVPSPEVLDPMVTYVDPSAKSIQGIGKMNRGAAQFFGWEGQTTVRQIKDAGVYFGYKNIKQQGAVDPTRSRIDRNHDARNEASGMDSVRVQSYGLIGDNKQINVLNWFTWYRGKLVFVTLCENRTKVIRYEVLKDRRTIPVIDRYLFPISHQMQGVSIPDLVEDKQRARSVLQNYALRVAKSSVTPRYIYNSNKIKNKRDLDEELNKHIGIDGDPSNAIVPVQTAHVTQDVQFILDVLDTASQRATATPEQQQGIPTDQRRTLGELQLVNQGVDARYSLGARIFGWSERRFWQEWYLLYKQYMAEVVDEKVVRIAGAGGTSWKKLTRANIVTNRDPDIKITAKSVADAKRLAEHTAFRQYVGDVVSMDPNANMRYALKELGRRQGIRGDVIEHLLPPDVNEMQAEDENNTLSNDDMVEVLPTDQDAIHLIVHEMASDTPAKYAHMQAHKRAMLLKKLKPELFPDTTQNPEAGINPAQGMGMGGGEGAQPRGGVPQQPRKMLEMPKE